MLRKGFRFLTSLILVLLLMSACGTGPNNHDLEENNLNEPPVNKENEDFNNRNNNFNNQDDLNDLDEDFNNENRNQ